MKTFTILLYISLIFIIFTSCNKKKLGNKHELKNEIDSISYYTGIFASRTLQNLDYEKFNSEAFYKGIHQALSDSEPNLTKGEVDNIIGWYFNKFRNDQSEKSMKEGQAFLIWNKTRKGVMTDTTGLQYEVIKEGKGAKPRVNDKVLIQYKGYFINGKEFINSYAQSHPDTFLMKNGNIPGFYKALQLMKAGSTYKIYVPSKLGFGLDPPKIEGFKPNMTIIFELELLSIMPPKPN